MRVLIAAIGVAIGGCYSPGVADCQFTCGAEQACPDGTTCMAGFCRTSSTGTCPPIRNDAAVDAGDLTDCPAKPLGCGARFKMEGGRCAVICESREKWDQSATLCDIGGWESGKLTITELDGLEPLEPLWVGAARSSGWLWRDDSAVPADLWHDGTAPIGGESCGHVTVLRRLSNSVACNDKLPRLCTER